jgi:hypothetical protein
MISKKVSPPLCSCIVCHKEITFSNIGKHYNFHFKPAKLTKICPKCGSGHTKDGIFCSHSCANSRVVTEESNIKRSATLKNNPKPIRKPILKLFTKVTQCKVCNKFFPAHGRRLSCSKVCHQLLLSAGGKNSAANQVRRSKDEIALYEYCKSHFEKVEHNLPIFNGWDADIIIHDIKMAILWNGPWHYKEMGFKGHSLLQVQNRDKIKIKEIKALGWNVSIFEDRYFTPQTAFEAIKNNEAGSGV